MTEQTLVGFKLLMRAREFQARARYHFISTALFFSLALAALLMPLHRLETTYWVLSCLLVMGLAGCITLFYCGLSADSYQKAAEYWSFMKHEEDQLRVAATSQKAKEAFHHLEARQTVCAKIVPLILGPWQDPYHDRVDKDSK